MSAPGNSQAFFTYWFLALGAVLLFAFIVSHTDEILDVLESIFDTICECLRNCPTSSAEELHRRRARRWRIALPFLNHARIRREYSKSERKAKKRSMDAVAETMATHQELLETMYGEAPTIREAYRRIGRYKP